MKKILSCALIFFLMPIFTSCRLFIEMDATHYGDGPVNESGETVYMYFDPASDSWLDVKSLPSSIIGYYTEVAARDIVEDLVTRNGIDRESALSLQKEGLTVYLSLDTQLQASLDQIVNDTSIWSQDINKNNTNLAIIVMDHQNLSINALMGGFGAYNSENVNAAYAYFGQPGSAFSPLSVYAPALDNGIVTESTIIPDEFVYDFGNFGGWPTNWDRTFGDPVSVRVGFQRQLNTVAAAIIKELTPELSYKFLKDNFDFTALNDMDIYASISIGSLNYGVTPLQLLSAYQIFGRDGEYAKPFTYSKVFDVYGNEILSNDMQTASSKLVISKKTADLIFDMMTGGIEYARAAEVNVVGRIGYVNNGSEIWYIGLTPQYTFLLYLSNVIRDKKLTDEILSQSHLAFTNVIEAISNLSL